MNRGLQLLAVQQSWLVVMVSLAIVFSATRAGAAEQQTAESDFFEKEIRPVLVKHCYECHSAEAVASKKLKGGLRLDSRTGMRTGGDSGPAVVPGNAADSLLIAALKYEDFEMPPTGRLPDAVIDDFARWINAGAYDPRTSAPDVTGGPVRGAIDMVEGRQFWAFQRPRKTAPPEVRDGVWPRSPIDRFVLARLETAGLRPVADASREALIRRLSFDLTGLPPTPAEVDAFVDDTSANAVEKIVDRLLDSPHFGERWGRHWLDVARFAESSGGGRSLMFNSAWRYRDYVIAAYNDDKPFDQFVREQLAGDLLPWDSPAQRAAQLTATGFLVLGPTNYEQQDKQLLKMDVIDEQIEVTGRALLGMTLGCARCHDHKFDPVPTSDYYALAGIFGSTKTLTPGNVSGYVQQPLPLEPPELAALQRYREKVAELTGRLDDARGRLDALRGKSPAKSVVSSKNRAKSEFPGVVVDNTEARLVGDWQESTHTSGFVGGSYIHDQNQDRGSKSAVFTPKLASGGYYDVRISYTVGGNRASNVPVTIDHQDGRATVIVNQAVAPALDGIFVSLGKYRFEADSKASVTISNKGTDGYVIVDAVQFLPVQSATSTASQNRPRKQGGQPAAPPQQRPPEPQKPASADPKPLREAEALVKRLDAELKQLKKKAPRPQRTVMSVMDEKKPADGHIHIRGAARSLGPRVPRGFLTVAMPVDAPSPVIPEDQSGRLQLAAWIADAKNPLTAHVYVNRIWHHLFGAGLVRTTDNFGSMGERPSHPELLDYLAIAFVEDGWSTKRLIRRILLSRVYQLGSSTDEHAAAADPENRLWWRANRRRLDAEALRDAMLSVSGKLDTAMGGMTIKKLSQYDLGYQFGEVRRRSVYVPRFRNAILDFFEVFDVANPNLVAGRRSTSTLPTQALFLMNSPFVLKQAEHAAQRLLAKEDLDDQQRIENAYRIALGRRPTTAERQLATDFIEGYLAAADEAKASADAKLQAWRGLYHMLFACLDFRYLH